MECVLLRGLEERQLFQASVRRTGFEIEKY